MRSPFGSSSGLLPRRPAFVGGSSGTQRSPTASPADASTRPAPTPRSGFARPPISAPGSVGPSRGTRNTGGREDLFLQPILLARRGGDRTTAGGARRGPREPPRMSGFGRL